MRASRMLAALAAVAWLGFAGACGSGGGGGSGGGSGGSSGGAGGGSGASGSATFSGGLSTTVTPTTGTITAIVTEVPDQLPDGGAQSNLNLRVTSTLPNGDALTWTNSTVFDLPLVTGAYAITASGEPVSFVSTTLDIHNDGGSFDEQWEEDYEGDTGADGGNGNFSVTFTTVGAFSVNNVTGEAESSAVHGSFAATLLPEGNGDAGVLVNGSF